MRGKKPKERQRYVLRVNETLIEVTRDVYLAWYQSRRKERYQLEKMQKFGQALMQDDSDKVSLVVTAPPSFSINARTTMNVVSSMIEGAESSILITGYSLSSYFADLVDTIIQKSQSGIFVKFFVNDIDSQDSFEKLLRYKGRFLKIYNYKKQEDSMAALHAKVISVDQKKTLITSANLSYHGQQGNIELGMLAESKKIAKQLDDVFTKLIFAKVFTEI